MKVSQPVKVNNDKLDAHGKAGHVLSEDVSAGTVVVQIDGDDEPTEFNRADLVELS